MTFDILSSATTVGHQKAHHSLLNSNISKLIHDQGKSFAHKTLTGILFYGVYYGIEKIHRKEATFNRLEDFTL